MNRSVFLSKNTTRPGNEPICVLEQAHPKMVVDDNPEDPIFWSTCLERVKIREWLPLQGAENVPTHPPAYASHRGRANPSMQGYT